MYFEKLKNNVGDLALSISLESEEPLAEEVKCYLKLKNGVPEPRTLLF